MKKIWLDFETRGVSDLKRVGAFKYAQDIFTEPMCLAFSTDGTSVQLLTEEQLRAGAFFNFGKDIPKDAILIGHSVHFEYATYGYILHKRYGYTPLWSPSRWKCTLAKCAMANLPLSLENASAALGLKTQKDMTGRSAMLKLTKPISIDPLGFPTYNEDEKLKQTVYEYCAQDVRAEMELDARLPDLPPGEQKVWELDLVINRRGVKADIETAQKAVVLADTFTKELNQKLYALTGGAVDKASRIAEIKRYLTTLGMSTPDSLDKNAVAALLANPDTPQKAKEVVKIRQQVGKSSTAKYQTILDYASPIDGRMRGMLQYHAAGTGRWGGRGPQPQNFPKGIGFKSDKVCEDIRNLSESQFRTKYGDKSMDALSAALRGVMYSNNGNILFSADYSAIEARVLLWLADDQLALGKYKMGINLYVDMAKDIYHNPDIKNKETHPAEYAVGKATILGCGFGMGARRFTSECGKQGIDMDEERAGFIIKAYRAKYKPVVSMWYAQEAAARSAVRTPGSVHPCGKVVWGMDKKKEFLVCKLPSGRHLRYFQPSLKSIITPYGEKEEICYWAAYDSSQKKKVLEIKGGLAKFKTYGGSLTENITQATARDVMVNGMFNIERIGFPVILTVHDDVTAESPEKTSSTIHSDEYRHKEFIKAMCYLPPWAAGMPITAEGWVGKRYRK